MTEKNIVNQTNDLLNSINPVNVTSLKDKRTERMVSQLEIRKQQILDINNIEKDSPFYEWVEGIYNDAIQIIKMTV